METFYACVGFLLGAGLIVFLLFLLRKRPAAVTEMKTRPKASSLTKRSPDATAAEISHSRRSTPLRSFRKSASRLTGVTGLFSGKKAKQGEKSNRGTETAKGVAEATPFEAAAAEEKVEVDSETAALTLLLGQLERESVQRHVWEGDSVEAYCSRFLRARKGDVNAALSMIKTDLEWRCLHEPKRALLETNALDAIGKTPWIVPLPLPSLVPSRSSLSSLISHI